MALFLVFLLYPIIRSFILSLHARIDGRMQWVGLDQYRRLIADPVFWESLGNTMVILGGQVPLMLAVALLLASILRGSWLRFRGGLRLLYFLPAVTALIAYSIVFRVLLNGDTGVMNQLIGLVGIEPINWLGDPFWSRVSIVAAVTWRWTGYNMVILLAGLTSIDPAVNEAARVDGANAWQRTVHVTIPMLRPVLVFCIVVSTIGTLQLFDEPYVITRGGPAGATQTVVLYLYRTAFQRLDFGYGSAIAYALVLVVLVLALVQLRFLSAKEDE
ncbi:MAG: sugar ABC transporter permease [Propionicimonas sp.]